MPRSYVEDILMSNKFHLYDVSLTIPPVLIPLYGFSSITSPELGIEYEEIKEGNFEYPRKVFKSASTSPVVLSRGNRLQDNDFWVWASQYVEGKRDKKNLMLVQFSNVNGNLAQDITGGVLAKLTDGDGSNFRVPARAWVLINCSPGRYVPSNDFDANSNDVSIQSLEIIYEYFTEFNMGTA